MNGVKRLFNDRTLYDLAADLVRNNVPNYSYVSDFVKGLRKFPLGNLLKSDVRKIAEKENLITYDKKDSTGICFIGERPFPEFLKNYLPEDYGDIVDENDDVIGEHKGLYFYTIGQRQGLGIGGMKNRAEKAWYVAQKDFSKNKLIVVQENDHPLLFKQKLSVSNINWLKQPSSNKISAKIRYRQKDQTPTNLEVNLIRL